ncbi:hypothetical protein DRQ33_04270 [bacterium]|nr:MAG: hypothetical protein DRQ33_04270 [bacterium]
MKKVDDKKFLRGFLIFIIPLILLITALDRGGTDPNTKEMLSILLWGIGIMVLWGLHKHFKIPIIPAISWFAFWCWGTFTIIFSYSPDATLRFAIQFGSIIAFAWAIYNIAEKPLWKFFRMFYITVAIILAIGYIFLMGAKFGLFVGKHDMMFHFISTFYWKNPAAGYLILLIPILFVLTKSDPSKGWRIFYWILSITAFTALLLTRSRAGWLAFTIAVILGIIISFRIAIKYLKSVIVTLLVGFILAGVIMPPSWIVGRIAQIGEVTKEKPEEPVQERWMMLDMGIRAIAENPITGVGMNGFKIAYPHFLKSSHYLSSHLHNQYIQYAAEGGLPASILFLCAIISSVVIIFISARKSKQSILWAIGIGTLAYSIHIGLDFDWQFWGTTLPYFTLIAIGLRNAYNPDAFNIKTFWKIIFTILLVLGFLFSTIIAIAWTFHSKYEAELSISKQKELLKLSSKFAPLSAYFKYELAMLEKMSGNRENALHIMEKTHSLEPKNIQISYDYAMLLYETNPDSAIKIMLNTLKSAPYVLPEKQLELANYLNLSDDKKNAKSILEQMALNFSTDPEVRYSARTASFRYIIARALEYLADMESEQKNYTRADSLYALSHKLGCPRHNDQLAKIWAIDTPAPEWIVYELIDAVNVNDTLRLREIIADTAMVKLSPGVEIYLERIMDVKINMLEEKAKVSALVLKCQGNRVHSGFEFFDLVLTEDGWKIKF